MYRACGPPGPTTTSNSTPSAGIVDSCRKEYSAISMKSIERPAIDADSIGTALGTYTTPPRAPRGEVRRRRSRRLPPGAAACSTTASSGAGTASGGAGAVKARWRGAQGNGVSASCPNCAACRNDCGKGRELTTTQRLVPAAVSWKYCTTAGCGELSE